MQSQQLCIACDGPRDGNEGDTVLVAEIQKIVNELAVMIPIYTGLEIKTLMWAPLMPLIGFSQVDSGIILEDDCLPSPFF